ncbi:MAG TPA: hypothetical protein DEV93_03475 [Chloroflexi bacterium]|jgi:hypothetical protein|nr:hypothetical protein [Chloroflexota bacterium]
MTPRTEYGARIVCPAAVVYMKDFDKSLVDAFLAEYGPVTPLVLVTRIWTGDTHTGWELAA